MLSTSPCDLTFHWYCTRCGDRGTIKITCTNPTDLEAVAEATVQAAATINHVHSEARIVPPNARGAAAPLVN